MSETRALRFAVIGAVLVGGALWLAPPVALQQWLGGTPTEPGSPVTVTPPPDTAATGQVNPLSVLTEEDVAEVTTRPLFNPDRAAAPEEPPPDTGPTVDTPPEPPAPDVTAADFSLLAIAGAAETRVALVRFSKTNKVYHVRQGQFVEEWKVAEVGLRDAALERDGTTLSLRLFDGSKPKPPPPVQPDAGIDAGADVPIDNPPPPEDGTATDPAAEPPPEDGTAVDPATEPQ